MSVMSMWSVCDRCGFNFRRRYLRKETTNFVVCRACDDGRFDLKNHPQNYPPPTRREPSVVPDGRPQQDVPGPALLVETGSYLLTNDGEKLSIVLAPWTPFMSMGR